jgi:hypothetical protein
MGTNTIAYFQPNDYEEDKCLMLLTAGDYFMKKITIVIYKGAK